MPNGVVTKGMVPPYPRTPRCVPINGFKYDVASFWAARPERGTAVSIMRQTANLFMTGNCILHAYVYGKLRLFLKICNARSISTDWISDEKAF
jgi:hypothetical protein